PRDGACTFGGSGWHPELASDCCVIGLGGSAEVPRSQSLGGQLGADIAGVVRVDPGVVLAAALIVGKSRADPFVERLRVPEDTVRESWRRTALKRRSLVACQRRQLSRSTACNC